MRLKAKIAREGGMCRNTEVEISRKWANERVKSSDKDGERKGEEGGRLAMALGYVIAKGERKSTCWLPDESTHYISTERNRKGFRREQKNILSAHWANKY